MSTSSCVDYEALVRTFLDKDSETDKLEEKKRESVRQFQAIFQEFVQTQAEHEVAVQKRRLLHFTLKEEKVGLKSLQDEKTNWDKLLEAKQKKVDKLKEIIKKDSAIFKENCEMLYVKYEKYADELNNETLTKEIGKVSANKESLENVIAEMELELQRVYDQPENEFTRVPRLKELTETIEQESVELYGKPHELKKKLRDLQHNINFLKEQVDKLENM